MRLLNGLVLILALLSNPVLAQIAKLVVDDTEMPGSDIDRVFINRAGGLEIQSVSGDYAVQKVGIDPQGAGSLINNFTWQNGETDISLQIGISAELAWSAANADGCVASTAGAGSQDDWNADTDIGTEGPHSVTFSDAGDYVLLLDCISDEPEGSRDTDAVSVTVEGASITSFIVTPAEVVKGESTTLTFDWETNNAESCSGNWTAETIDVSGTGNWLVTLNSSKIFILTCKGPSGDLDTVEETFEVVVPTIQQSCNVTLTGFEANWNSVFRNNWPGPKYEKKTVSIKERGYLAIKFNTGEISETGGVTTIEAAGTPGWRLGSISRCAGHFDVEDVACTYKWGDNGGITWDTTGVPDADHCNLDPNEDYYWNITFTDGNNPNTSRCAGSYCMTTLIPVNMDFVE